jgi:hypothetical protein
LDFVLIIIDMAQIHGTTSNIWQVKTKLAKQSEYDDREYHVVAAIVMSVLLI